MIINEKLVKLNINASNKEDVLKELVAVAFNEGKVNNQDIYKKAVLKREEEFSTAVGFGVAIPHGKSEAVSEAFFMFATVDSIDWNSMDGEPVDMVFLIGVPSSEAGSTHLNILAALSRKLMKAPFREALRGARTESDVINVLKESELGL